MFINECLIKHYIITTHHLKDTICITKNLLVQFIQAISNATIKSNDFPKFGDFIDAQNLSYFRHLFKAKSSTIHSADGIANNFFFHSISEIVVLTF